MRVSERIVEIAAHEPRLILGKNPDSCPSGIEQLATDFCDVVKSNEGIALYIGENPCDLAQAGINFIQPL